jgi:hypothetical protein
MLQTELVVNRWTPVLPIAEPIFSINSVTLT